MPAPTVVNLGEKLATVDDHWAPRVVAELNDYQVKVARIAGEFVWHAHPDTDELFLVLAGTLGIEFRDRTVEVQPGELIVVPRGVEHRPFSAGECHIALIEPRGVVNTGDGDPSRRAPNDIWA